MISNSRRVLQLPILVLLTALVAGCAGGNGQSGDTKGQSVQGRTVTIGISPIAVYTSGYQMVPRLEKRGITVKLQKFESTPQRLTALVSGDIDMTFGGFTDTIKLASRGAPLVMVSNAGKKGYGVVVKAKGDIQSFRDLKGEDVAIPRGTIQEMALRYELQRVGLDADEDINALQMKYPDMPVALKKDQIPAFSSTAPYNAIAVAGGYGKFLHYQGLPWGNLNSGLVTTRQFVSESPKMVNAVVDSLQKTTRHLNSNKKRLKEIYVSKFNVPPEAVDVLANNMVLTTAISKENVNNLIEAELEVGYIENAPKVSSILNTSYLGGGSRDYGGDSGN